MVSISKKTVSLVVKIGFTVLVLYTVGFMFYKIGSYYKTYYEKQKLMQELQIKKNETSSLKRQIKINKARIESVKNSYISKEELGIKIKDIFQRMSVFDYDLRYLDAKQMCVDRYILVTQLTYQSENGKTAGEGILSYIGEVQKSDKNESLYFVDYITKPKGNRK